MAITDARVKFLRGLQADLPSTKTDGNVYVAYDERAMYIDYIPTGSSTVERVRLGDIIEVATENDLPGQNAVKSTTALYYVTSGNMLVKWDPTQVRWVQINGQNITNVIKDMAWNVTTASDISTIKLVVTKPDNTTAFENALTYKLASANPNSLKITSAKGTDNKYTITLRAADLTDTSEMSTTTVAYSTNEVPLNLYNYNTGTDASGATISKPASLTATSTIKFAGDGIVHAKSDATTGVITLGAKLSGAGAWSANGTWTLTVKDTILNVNAFTATMQPLIQIGHGGATIPPIAFENGIATLDVYTASQVDTQISNATKAMDSMTFKGTVGDSSAGASINNLPLAANTVQIGDTYKVVTAKEYTINNLSSGNTLNAAVGDMFIATSVDGTESNGYIEASKIRWTYIPSGDDVQNIKFTFDSSTKDFYVAEANLNKGVKLRIDETDLTTSSTGSGANQVVTLAHKSYGTITPTADSATNASVGVTGALYGSATFTAITGITISNGHVTAVKTGQISVGSLKLKSLTDVSALYNGSTAVTASASAKATDARLTTTITYQDNTSASAYFALNSRSLTFTKASASDPLGVDLLWETF